MSAIWPFRPLAPHLEALEWLTDVQTARSGLELRSALRTGPRVVLEMEYNLRAPAERARFEALSYTSQDQVCGLPWWPGQRDLGPLAAGVSRLDCDTAGAGFRPGGRALVIRHAESWEAAEIAAVDPDGLTLAAPLAGSYPRAQAAPLLSCRMDLAFTRRDLPTGRSLGSAVFTALDPEPPDPGRAGTVWEHAELFPQRLWCDQEGMERRGSRAAEELDNRTGGVRRVVHSESTASVIPLRLRADTPEQSLELRRFLHRLSGRLTAFWLPTGRADLALAAPVAQGATVLTVAAASCVQLLASPARRALCLRAPDGAVLPRRVSSARALDGGLEELTVTEALPAIPVSARVSWLVLARLDADRVELSWERAGCCRVETRAREVWL